MIEKMIQCYVFNKKIEKGLCFEFAMAAEGWGPSYIKMMMEVANPEFKSICLNCEKHPQKDSSATLRR